LGFSILFEQVSIPPGIYQESSRNARNSWGILWFYPIPPGILPFLVRLPGFLEESSRKRGGSVKFRKNRPHRTGYDRFITERTRPHNLPVIAFKLTQFLSKTAKN
jgi:hypothetical protein